MTSVQYEDSDGSMSDMTASRAYSLPARLRASRPSPHQAAPHSSVSITSALTSHAQKQSVLDSDSETGGAYSSSSDRCSSPLSCQHNQSPERFTSQAQYPLHGACLQAGLSPQHTETSHIVSDQSDDGASKLDMLAPQQASRHVSVDQLKPADNSLSRVLSLAKPEEAAVADAAVACLPYGLVPVEAGTAPVELTAQHVRERYPYLVGNSQPAAALSSHAALSAKTEPPRKTTSFMTSAAIAAHGKPPDLADSVSLAQKVQPEQACMDCSEAEEEGAASADYISKVQDGQELSAMAPWSMLNRKLVTARQGQGLHAAALHESPLRHLLQESQAASAQRLETGVLIALCACCCTTSHM